LAGAIEGYAGVSQCLGPDCGMTDDLCEDKQCSMGGQVAMPDWCDCRGVCGAVWRDG
jgi:hypothetical protein